MPGKGLGSRRAASRGYPHLSGILDVVTPVNLAVTTLTDTVVHRGVVFTLTPAMPVCRTCLDDPVVISTQPFTVTANDPATGNIEGTTGTWKANGAMLDPGDFAVTGQGFDEMLNEPIPKSGVAYVDALNVSDGVAFAQGAKGSFVKGVRVSGLVDPGPFQTIESPIILTVLDEVPLANLFRPGLVAGAKTVYGTADQVSMDIFQNLAPLPDATTKEDAEIWIKDSYLYTGITNGEQYRRIDSQENALGSNYSRDFTIIRSRAQSFLHDDHPDADKRLVALRCVQAGIDIAESHIEGGYLGHGGAGQNFGRAFFSYVAAFALKSQVLLDAAHAMSGIALNNHFWVEANDVNSDVAWPSSSGTKKRFKSPLLDAEIGLPEWSFGSEVIELDDADPNARYRNMFNAGMTELLNVCLLQNGPGGMTGWEAMLDGPYDMTNRRAASIAYYDRQRVRPDRYNHPSFNNDFKTRWDVQRALIPLTPWTGRPDWIADYERIEAGVSDGEISYDWSDYTYSTLPITQRNIRYSLDGLQFVELSDVAAIGTLSDLTLDLEHYVGFQIENSAGVSRWTPNYPLDDLETSESLRNVLAPVGTGVDAVPENTVVPRLLKRVVFNWPGSEMQDAGASYSLSQLGNEENLYAGVGYWTGFPAPVLSYQWKMAGGVDITGETKQALSLKNRFDLSEQTLYCEITATNTQGVITVPTQTIQLPAITPPADYTADFALHDDSLGWVGSGDVETGVSAISYDPVNGALDVTLGGAFSGAQTPSVPIVIGNTYQIDVVMINDTGSQASVVVRDTAAPTDVLFNFPNQGGSGTRTFSAEVTLDANEIFVEVRRTGLAMGSVIQVKSVSIANVSRAEAVEVVTSISPVTQTVPLVYNGQGNSTDVTVAADIGEADDDRWIVVKVGGLGLAGEVDTITVAGVPCTKVAGTVHAGSTAEFSHIWVTDTKVPSETVVDIFVTKSGTVYSLGIEIDRLIKAGDATVPFATATLDSGTVGNLDQVIDINTADQGVMSITGQLFSSSGGNVLSLTPDIEDKQTDIRSGEKFINGSLGALVAETPRSQTIKTSNNGTLSACAVSWD